MAHALDLRRVDPATPFGSRRLGLTVLIHSTKFDTRQFAFYPSFAGMPTVSVWGLLFYYGNRCIDPRSGQEAHFLAIEADY